MTITKAILAAVALAGIGCTAQPASAFYGSFEASCHDVHIYGGGAYMTAYCRRLDGGWRYASIANCGGAGVHNSDGYLSCGS